MKKGLFYIALGALSALPIVMTELGILQWIFMIPFALLCLREKRDEKGRFWRKEYFRGFLFFFGFYAVGYCWFFSMYPLSVTGLPPALAMPIVALAALGIPVFQSLGFALIIPIFNFGIRRKIKKLLLPILMGALSAVFEWLQGCFWFGLPFVRLSLGQIELLPFIQSANLFGSYFVSFLIVAVNFYIALAIKETEKRAKRGFALAAAVIFIANSAYGVANLTLSSKREYNIVGISALQGNVSTKEKWEHGAIDASMEIYSRLSEAAKEEGAEFVLFPETVIPHVVENHPETESALGDIAWKYDLTLMVGIFSEGREGTENVIRVYEPMRDGKNVYTKQRNVPFGEYVPMRSFIMKVLPALGEINMLDRALVPGKESRVWESDEATFGFMICFDSIYDNIARESVKNGAQVLMLSTNDSWFGDSAGTKMHFAQAKLRAIENGRSVVRAANTGISAIIDPNGREIKTLECNKEGLITADVPLGEGLTLYTRIGNIFIILCAFFTIILLECKNIGTKLPFFRLK